MSFRQRVEKWISDEEKRIINRINDSRIPSEISSLRGSQITLRKIKEELFGEHDDGGN